VTTNFDTFLLSRFAGSVALGPYSLGKALSHTALDQIAGIVNDVSVPTFAAQTDASVQRAGLIKVVSLASTVLFPLFWLMGVLSQVAFPLVFGSRWDAIIVSFCAFCFVLPLRGLYTFLDACVVGTGRTSTTFKNMLLWAAVMMPLLFVGVTTKVLTTAAYGAAAAWVVSIPIVFVAAIRRIARAFDARAVDIVRPMVIPVICAAISSVAVEVLHVTLLYRVNSLILFVCEAFGGGLCYLLTIRTFGRSHFDEVLRVLARLVPFLRYST
jgi:O-antigen/teichoic acid export membrane protein